MDKTRSRRFAAALLVAVGATALCQCGSTGAVPGPRDAAEPARPAADPTDSEIRSSPPAGDGVLRAFLVRSRTGRPIPGSLTVTGPNGLLRTAVAGPDGSVCVDGLPRGAILDAVARSPGLLPLPVTGIRLWHDGDDSLGDLSLGEAVPVEILVTDEEDRPVAGAVFEVRGARLRAVPHSFPPPVAGATTGKDGRAVVPGVPAGQWQGVTRAHGHGADRRELDLVEGALREPLRIHLGPAHRLEGRLLDARGRPTAGTEVVLAHSRWWGPFETTRTDAAGRFRFEGLPEGEFPVAFRPLEGVLEVLEEVKVPGPGPVDLRMLPRGEIRGRVVDDATGGVIGGARVHVDCRGEPRGGGWMSQRGSWIGTAAPAETALDGSFFVGDLPFGVDATPGDPGCWVSWIGAYGEGFVQEWLPRRGRAGVAPPCVVAAGSPPADATLLEFRLRRGTAVLRGVVRTEDGSPVPGAWVTLGFGDPKAEWWILEATSDAEGRYRMPPAPPGTARVAAGAYMLHLAGTGGGMYKEPIHPDRIIELPSSGEVVKDLVLVPDSVIEGRMVLADGRPATGYLPVLVNRNGSWSSDDRGVPSAEDGSFRLEELLIEEDVAIEARGPRGTMGISARFDIAESAHIRDVVVRVVLPASVSGRVVGPDGRPIADAFVRLHSREPGDRDHWGSGIDVDTDGGFLAEDLEAGPWEAVAHAPGRLASVGVGIDLAEGEKRTGLVLALREGASITGRVLDGAGEPVGGAAVGAFGLPKPQPFSGNIMLKPGGPGDAEQSAESGPDGTFRISGLEDTTYNVAAWKEGLVGSVLSAAAGEEGVDLLVRRPTFVSGVVVDPAGNPIEGASVELVAPETPPGAKSGPRLNGIYFRFGWCGV